MKKVLFLLTLATISTSIFAVEKNNKKEEEEKITTKTEIVETEEVFETNIEKVNE